MPYEEEDTCMGVLLSVRCGDLCVGGVLVLMWKVCVLVSVKRCSRQSVSKHIEVPKGKEGEGERGRERREREGGERE